MTKIRQNRSLKLIANFIDGYAEGWHFAVGTFFRNQLDIKLIQRKEKGKSIMRWTQGPYYCFDEGHILYDTPKGYLNWNEALKYINIICDAGVAGSNPVVPTKDNNKLGRIKMSGLSVFLHMYVQYLESGHVRRRSQDFLYNTHIKPFTNNEDQR